MIGVAQVIGMKPTFRSFFSGAPVPWANSSVALSSGKNARARQARSRRRPTAGTRGAPHCWGRPRASPPRRRRARSVPGLEADAFPPARARRGLHAARRGSVPDDRDQAARRRLPSWSSFAASGVAALLRGATTRGSRVPARAGTRLSGRAVQAATPGAVEAL